MATPTLPVMAAAPESVCITKETLSLRANAEAKFTKDTAPYEKKPGAAQAIATYRQHLDVAWDALNQPYCGYGQTSIASVKKSYTKTVTRASDAFLQAAKKGFGDDAAPAAPVATTPAPVATPVAAPASESAPKSVAKTALPPTGSVPKGLQRGMRSEGVRQAQIRLARYYKIADESSLTTGYFGPMTEGYVIKFQLEKALIDSKDDPAAGLIGPKTAKALNDIDL